MTMPNVTIEQTGQTLEVASGTTLLQALDQHGVAINHDCGGNGVCGTCRVFVTQGMESLGQPTQIEQFLIDRYSTSTAETRLSCQVEVQQDLRIRLMAGPSDS